MGTHPIFESDFDCLTEMRFVGVIRRNLIQSERRSSPLPGPAAGRPLPGSISSLLFKSISLGGFGICCYSYGKYNLTPFDYPEMAIRSIRLATTVAFIIYDYSKSIK